MAAGQNVQRAANGAASRPAAPASAAAAPAAPAGGGAVVYRALWRKITNKKIKTWQGDGTVTLRDGACVLQEAGKVLGRTKVATAALQEGELLRFGGCEAEIECVMDRQEAAAAKAAPRAVAEPENAVAVAAAAAVPREPKQTSLHASYKAPFSSSDFYHPARTNKPTPKHDPEAENALVMPRPAITSGREVVDVVVDPYLARHLRPHQREGVTFLYECVMGMKSTAGCGALLADEMGLGKTLMTISLIWTLLKQNPFWGRGAVVRKALVVCPATLIRNWRREFYKWLGRERVAIFVADGKIQLADFVKSNVYQVLIIGYEKLRQMQQEVKGVQFDLVVCDEGHRIKSATNKSAQVLRAMDTDRRILLTGTPIQNDLGEFFTMIDFINPGLFESYNAFKKEYETPIVRSRQPNASKRDVELGKERSQELSQLTRTFVLRRTADILAKYLPPKNEYVVFCRPTAAQLAICRAMMQSASMKYMLGSTYMSDHLRAITALKKICNSPSLVAADDGDKKDSLLAEVDPALLRARGSGKLAFLEAFMRQLRARTDEKVVLVSSYTQTLDVLQRLLVRLDLTFLRLDGSTPSARRQELVDAFNRQGTADSFAFLLSAKSGGAGINLIGASRLVLFDTDWNPSVDLQAMARIHRDGQRRPVYIYRLLTTGCIDEKIYQRQLTKQGLADSLMDGKTASAENSFTQDELRDLFTVHPDTLCNTHDLLGCSCRGLGEPSAPDDDASSVGEPDDWQSATQLLESSHLADQKRAKARLKALLDYSHIDPAALGGATEPVADAVLASTLGGGVVSYMFRIVRETADEPPEEDAPAESAAEEAEPAGDFVPDSDVESE
ncbi:SNF2 family N-terminal domain-containing protein [Dipodascopsis tothii]|uniref:SNF2 family N-terminal domain-containing protein n=1 Tax=Dipodascopsis tothii TaxID=44089 RepID=UPI0034CF4633